MIDIDLKELGRKIKELRVESGLYQSQLAEMVGLAQNTISQYENGTNSPSIETLANLAIVLKTTTDYLLGLED